MDHMKLVDEASDIFGSMVSLFKCYNIIEIKYFLNIEIGGHVSSQIQQTF